MTPKEFRKWKVEQDAAIKAQREKTVSLLRYLVPEELATYFTEEVSIIDNLLEYGRAGRKYYDSEGVTYGFTDLRDLRRKLRRLRTAWSGLVKISTTGDDRLEVLFLVIG